MNLNIKIRPYRGGTLGWLWLLSFVLLINQNIYSQIPGGTITASPTEPITGTVSGANTTPPYEVVYLLVDGNNLIVASNNTGTFAPQPVGNYTLVAINHDGTFIVPEFYDEFGGCLTSISRNVQVQNCLEACAGGTLTASVSFGNTDPPYMLDYVLVCENSIVGTPNATGVFTLPNSVPSGSCIAYAINYDSSVGTPSYVAGAGNTLTVNNSLCYSLLDRCVTVNPTPNPVVTVTDVLCAGPTTGSMIISGLVPSSTYSVSYYFTFYPQTVLTGLIANPQGQIIISNLEAGSYSQIIVTNSFNCSSTPVDVIINPAIDCTCYEACPGGSFLAAVNTATVNYSGTYQLTFVLVCGGSVFGSTDDTDENGMENIAVPASQQECMLYALNHDGNLTEADYFGSEGNSLIIPDNFCYTRLSRCVTVEDVVPPSITCPGTQNLILDGTCSSTLPLYSALSATDNCGTPNVTQSPGAGSPVSGVGTNTVVLTATDGVGNTATCSFTVNRLDITPPSITCPVTQNLILNGTCTATLPLYSAAGTTDNCGTPSVSQSPGAGSTVTGVGTTTVTLTADDGNGNTATCSFSVNRLDLTAPSLSCPTTQTLVLDASCTATLPLYSAINPTDNCGTPSVTQSPLAGSTVSGVGTTTVTLTADDGNGNSASCTISVNRVDSTPPTITCPATQTLTLGAACNATLPSYSAVSTADNCGTPTVTQSPLSGTTVTGVGATTVVLTANDGNGNTTTCSFTVNRVDSTPPTITCPATQTLTIVAGCTATLPAYSAVSSGDNCGTPTVTQSPASGTIITGVGANTVVLTANDGNGNTATCSFTVNVVDSTVPTITCPATQTLTLGAACTATLPAYSAVSNGDNCGTPTVTQSPVSGTTVTGVGTTTVVLTANDGNGNTASCSFSVNRVDSTPPTVTCPATQTLTLGAACTATLPVYSAVSSADNCGTPTVTQSPASGTTVTGVGTTTVVLTANDGNGNTASCSFSVNRVDLIPATITCPTTQTLTLGAACTASLPAYSAVSTADNCGTPTVTQSPVSGTTVSGVGATTVTLTANDGNGNSPASCSFTVNRVDSTSPTITCPANITQASSPTSCTAVVSWATPTTSDNCAVATVTPSIPSGSTFSGTTTVNYTVTDASGNSANCSFTVTVNDGQPPVLSPCPANIVSCNNSVNWTPPTATDNCGTANVTGTHTSGSTFPLGTTTVTYTATDGSGNTATCSFTVTVSLLSVGVSSSNYNGFGVSCFGANNGTITVTPSGGIPPYSYIWSNGLTGTNTATGLAAGSYSVTISDPSGCTVVQTATLTQPQVLNCTATVTNPTCFGGDNGSITTSASGGIAPYTYTWSGPGGPYGNVSTISGLSGGTYTVTVSDANGCICINTVTVVEPPQISPIAGTSNIYEGSGGVIPTFYNVNVITFSGGLAPYNYTWNNTGYVVYSIPSPGTINIVYADNATWNVTITDSNGCGVGLLEFSSLDGTTNPGGILNIVNSATTPDFGTNNGTLVLSVSGGTPCPGGGYQYQWTGPTTWTGAPTATSNSLTNLPVGWYIVTVTDCGNPAQSTVGWFWVPKKVRGRGKLEVSNDLIQIAPNPFELATKISFSWPQDDVLQLEVFDVAGRIVLKPFTGEIKADQVYEIDFDGRALPNGMYICRLVNTEGISIQTKALHHQSK